MGGNNEFFENFERKKYLKKLPSMQRVNAEHMKCRNQQNHTNKSLRLTIISCQTWLSHIFVLQQTHPINTS